MRDRLINSWIVGEYTIFEVANWSDSEGAPNLFTFRINGGETSSTYYSSLDMALIAAVGEKHTGPAGASGPNVGTAAYWYAKMIGLTA